MRKLMRLLIIFIMVIALLVGAYIDTKVAHITAAGVMLIAIIAIIVLEPKSHAKKDEPIPGALDPQPK